MGLEKSSCDVNDVLLLVIVVPGSEKCQSIDCSSNCANLLKNYRNKININIQGHLG